MYYVIQLCVGLLYLLLALLILRQVLPFFGKKPSDLEKFVIKITEPIYFAADCFCRMAGVSLCAEGIDPRYPVGASVIMLAVCALRGLGGITL